VLAEAESEALARFVAASTERVSSGLAATEVRRAVRRTTDDTSYHADAEAVIRRTTLIAVSPQILLAAGLLQPWRLRSLDAIHVATALSLGDQLDAMAVYDARLAECALGAGLSVVAPGSSSD